MYRIRFHGRGGHGIKTAARVLGTAFFLEGFTVQDAPRYGAERRGAPIFAWVRAARGRIDERGAIARPDLVIVADDTLLAAPAAGVLAGAGPRTVLLVHGGEPAASWKERLRFPGPVLNLVAPERVLSLPVALAAVAGAGAAAALTGAIGRAALERAIREESAPLGPELLARSLDAALDAFARMRALDGFVVEGADAGAAVWEPPAWVELPLDGAGSAPAIHAAATSLRSKTGLWRTMRPVVHRDLCGRCWWVCGTLCPDGAISVAADGTPEVDLEHCKGCLVCVAVCPHHAIEAVPERRAGAAASEAALTGGDR